MAKETTTGHSSTTGGSTGPGAWTYGENPFLNFSGFSTDAWKELWSWQVKTGQHLMDQSIRWGQTWTDLGHTQFSDTTKVTQDFVRNGIQFSEELKKSVFNLSSTISEKFNRQNS